MFGNTSLSLEDLSNLQSDFDEKFDKVKLSYRPVISLLDGSKTYVSAKTFNSYNDAWDFLRKESLGFPPCELYVERIIEEDNGLQTRNL